MNYQAKNIEEAAAQLIQQREQATIDQQTKEKQQKAELHFKIKQAFENKYADVLPLIEASGITYDVADSEDYEDYWAELVFFKSATATRILWGVNNYVDFEIMHRCMSEDELILALADAFSPKTTPPACTRVSTATEPEQPVLRGRYDAAFARPMGNDGYVTDSNSAGFGLSKYEYFAGQAMQGLLAHGYDGHIDNLSLHAAQLAQSMLAQLAKD